MNVICEICRNERAKMAPEILEKEKIDGKNFSPVFKGFSSSDDSEELKIADFLIISESIGNLDHHMRKIRRGKTPEGLLKDYYMVDQLETFNQQEIRKLLTAISDLEKTFYFTDVIKCFVLKKKASKNFLNAAEYCSEKFLRRQVQMMKPRVVVLLGRLSEEMFFRKVISKNNYVKASHGASLSLDETKVVYSAFPSAMNADRFVKGGGIPKLKETISFLSESF